MGARGLFPSLYVRKDRTGSMNRGVKPLDYVYNYRPKRASSWVDTIYNRELTGISRANSFAVTLFTFDSEWASDLGFKKGNVITVTKKTNSTDD
jgi:SH3 domain-containing YSC84-like protein 1